MFEATIFEYEDTIVLGTFETRDQAVRAIGEFMLENGDIQFPRPQVTEV
jgi:hypothetical protein